MEIISQNVWIEFVCQKGEMTVLENIFNLREGKRFVFIFLVVTQREMLLICGNRIILQRYEQSIVGATRVLRIVQSSRSRVEQNAGLCNVHLSISNRWTFKMVTEVFADFILM